ncbi:regulator of G-protein signaling loco isoform X1 [Drosophila elegans]|uniref:regulator of G-protein signaling loco isoform X1 n=2 Tax=Drosophila elegans TaxID=30023 RepID=UPI0007E78B4E|nr:regulator of G-protein signaling loco isoform X1 [Drosophila elegans]
MHHHHPPLPITGASGSTAAGAGGAAGTAEEAPPPAVAAGPATTTTPSGSNAQQQQHQRRRKKRPNYNYNGIRTVEVRRGYNGFGFTISGQQPCRLSCIISSSPAEQAGLRSGDFLISVNGLNVSKLPHETVVQLIGNSFGSIRMQIAENYYSDSSDEENAHATLRGQLLAASLRHKPRFLHHKAKLHRLRNSPQKKLPLPVEAVESPQSSKASPAAEHLTLRPVLEDAPLAAGNPSKAAADVANVSAMVRAVGSAALEYRVIVGYLGTIEMPKQISHSSKLQTVRSCIRKLRQEKRQPTIVLMCITPDSLSLQSSGGGVLATYSSARLNYVSSSSESENRFFGLVTSAVHNTQIEEEYEPPSAAAAGHISISHSCHVFVIDTKLIEHAQHLQRAHEFRLQCTRDPISNLCLEFPNNSEYVVNLVRSMYTMRILPPASRSHQVDYDAGGAGAGGAAAHSPQPSNHSEISTTTSNSDSGIGFNNDCTNISDRILVVDFLGGGAGQGAAHAGPPNYPAPARPLGIVGIPDNRLTVRAMPDHAALLKSPSESSSLRRPNLLASFNLIKSPATNLTSTRSCDDVLNLFVDDSPRAFGAVASMDDISLHSAAPSLDETHTFAHPSCVPRKMRRSLALDTPTTPHKLSAQVFGQPGSRHSLGFEAIDSVQSSSVSGACIDQPMDTWASLQNLHKSHKDHRTSLSASSSSHCLLEATNSEPDLGNRALPANASPFRRAWGQSSFRTPRSDKVAKQQQQQQQLGQSSPVRRTASMNASDNDMYIKTLMLDSDLKATRSQQQLSLLQVPKILTTPAPPSAITVSVAGEDAAAQEHGCPSSWGSSFERMLQDAAGMQTFSEFLKKEFSAENIYFWTACERYRLLESEAERVLQAREIFGKHLANSSSDPVNVDSQARSLTAEKLATAAPDIFAAAQKQIFNLMKFDSYQRFIRSDLYKSCVEAEQKHQPLPYSGMDLDELLKTNFHLAASSKLKKSASNAEDRRRKSLLPWHRKTRSKSRDRGEIMADLQHTLMPAPPLPPPALLTSASLKLVSGQNSLSDLHSSRSSLSSFDAGTGTNTSGGGGQGASAESVCSLCRVILTDGATTIVQTRAGETVGELVERLLEKRNLVYPYYDIVFQGTTKSIDVQQPSQMLAGKEVLIERRVAFKLDLPDPKVISVKSKPKKQLHEVIRPILSKYNYKMEQVQVIMRDTQAPLDLNQPVTMADGQRLRILLLHGHSDFQVGGVSGSGSSSSSSMTMTTVPPKQSKPMKPLPQGQLDELTNKVFSELLASKVDAAQEKPRPSDLCSMKSNEAPSESSSSLFERMRRQQSHGSNIPGSKLPKLKKKSTSSQQSEEAATVAMAATVADPKKPIIAKLKAGVKLQVTERVAEHQDELLEGLKRAQLARLEDQRGTEINFDLPDFLKNKENLSAAVSKLRKVRASLSPVGKVPSPSPTEIPQPAPRLSITRSQPQSPMKVDHQELETELLPAAEMQDQTDQFAKAPPPLPPKPKVLPIKPSNWGVAPAVAVAQPTTANYCNKFSPSKQQVLVASPTKEAAKVATFASKIPLELGRKSLEEAAGSRCAYLDEPSSSFV